MVHRGSIRCACFHAHPEDWLIDRPRVIQIHLGSLFHQADSPSEFLELSPCIALSRAATTYLGFCPLLDIITLLPFFETPPSRWRIPRQSQPLLLPQCDLQACFILQPSPGLLFSFRGLSIPCSLRLSSSRFRPCRSALVHSPTNRLPRTSASTPTSYSTQSRCPRVWCLAAPEVAPLFEFHAPPGLPDSSERSYLLSSTHAVHSSTPPPISKKTGFVAEDRSSSALPASGSKESFPKLPTCPSFSDLPKPSLSKSLKLASNRSRLSTPTSNQNPIPIFRAHQHYPDPPSAAS